MSAAGLTQEEKMTSPSLSIRPNHPSGLLLNGLDGRFAWVHRLLATAMTLWIIRRDERMLLECRITSSRTSASGAPISRASCARAAGKDRRGASSADPQKSLEARLHGDMRDSALDTDY
jgi:hypothetical protein